MTLLHVYNNYLIHIIYLKVYKQILYVCESYCPLFCLKFYFYFASRVVIQQKYVQKHSFQSSYNCYVLIVKIIILY